MFVVSQAFQPPERVGPVCDGRRPDPGVCSAAALGLEGGTRAPG